MNFVKQIIKTKEAIIKFCIARNAPLMFCNKALKYNKSTLILKNPEKMCHQKFNFADKEKLINLKKQFVKLLNKQFKKEKIKIQIQIMFMIN